MSEQTPVTTPSKKAIILLSGGLDSATTAFIARSKGHELFAMSFRYGQRHIHEINMAKSIAAAVGVTKHLVVDIDLRLIGGSALTDEAIAVPKDRQEREIGQGIPVSYVPARNTIFLSFAMAWAEVLEARHIFLGVNAVDYSGYPDCRPEYITAYEKMARLATRAGVEGAHLFIHTPLISMRKRDIVAEGLRLHVPYGMTSSCYDPDALGRACGRCDSCKIRRQAFLDNDVTDPIQYQ